MKNLLTYLILLIVAAGCGDNDFPMEDSFTIGVDGPVSDEIKDGDIIFQTSKSSQSKAIQIATGSKYSHCGLIFKRKTGKDEWSVIEAVQPVKWTGLSDWIKRGEGGHYVVKRLITDPMIPDDMLKDLRIISESYLGKNYDIHFDWSDDKIYCSELVWKSYYRLNNFEIGELETLGDFDLTNNAVKQKLKERYGNNIPLNDTVISPKAIFNSYNLKTVKEK